MSKPIVTAINSVLRFIRLTVLFFALGWILPAIATALPGLLP